MEGDGEYLYEWIVFRWAPVVGATEMKRKKSLLMETFWVVD